MATTNSNHRLLMPDLALARLARANGLVVEQNYYPRWRRLRQAEDLIERYFPGKPVVGKTHMCFCPDWLGVLSTFLDYVEQAGWFGVDWPTLDYLLLWAQDDYQETDEELNDLNWEAPGFAISADYLTGIPVKCFGLGGIYGCFDESPLMQYPPLQMLWALLGCPVGLVQHYLPNFPVFHNLIWTQAIQTAAQRRLARLDITTLPKPLCWLLEMSKYACAKTGNVIMDTTIDATNDLWPMQWRWDTDLDFIKEQWAEAEAIRERFGNKICYLTQDLKTIRLALPIECKMRVGAKVAVEVDLTFIFE